MRPFLLLLSLLFSSPANAAEPMRFTYAVYGGGLHVVDAGLQLQESKATYKAIVNAKTQNTLGRLAPWSSVMVSEGWAGTKGWKPRTHYFTTRWRHDEKTIHLNYNKNGTIVSRTVKEKGQPDDTQEAAPELTNKAMDMPTGILNFLRHRTMAQGCEGHFAVYDGKRRFTIVMADQRNETMKATRYNIFAGKALSCSVEVKQEGGNWSKKNRGWFKIQEDSRKLGRLPRVTVAELPSVAGWLVPVRLDVASPYGTFIMHLTGTGKAVK